MKNLTIIRASLLLASAFALCGCGSPQKQANKDFFTSGSHEADQRASQRMAQAKQLKGDTSSGGPLAALTTPEDKPATLYDRLGGASGIESITDDFVARVMSDPRVNWRRYDVKEGGFFNFHRNRTVEWKGSEDAVKLMKKHIAQFLSLATGGPSTYEGKEMHQAHAGLHISNPEFDASVGDLKVTLDKLQLPVKEQKELLAIVESTRQEIVEER